MNLLIWLRKYSKLIMNNSIPKNINTFVNTVVWTFASTYAKTAPHEYIVREKLSDADKALFDEFATLIDREGYEQKFYDTTYKYYNIGDKKYWVIENILNRDDIKNIYK